MAVGLGNATTLLLEDASLSATQGMVASKATLALDGSDAHFSGDISLGYRSTLSVISPSTLGADKLLAGNGAIFSFTLSSGMTTPLLTYTGGVHAGWHGVFHVPL